MLPAIGRSIRTALLGLLLSPSLAFAAAVHWNNAAGGAWNVAANWSPAAVPTATDTAVIDLAGTYTVTMPANVSIAALRISGAASGVQTVSGTTRTVTLANASSIGAQGALSLTAASIVNGAGPITNDGSFTLAGTVAQALTNDGTLLLSGACSIAGTFANAGGALLRITGVAGNSSFTVANGFTNNGAIELTSTATAAASLTVTTGTLTNSSTGTITSLAGAGGARNLNTGFSNQGLITLAANTTTNKASVASSNAGTIDLTTGNYTIVVSGTSPSFTTTGTINVPSGRTLTLQGGVTGGAGQNHNFNGGAMGGAGTISLLNAQLNLNAALATSSAHLDVNTSTIGGASTLTFSAGTTTTLSSSTLNAPAVVEATGTLELVSSDQLGTLTNGGLVECTGACTTNGSITTQSGSVLRVTGIAGNSSLTSAGGFTNSAAIELTSAAAAAASLTVTTGTLTNGLTGTISSLAGAGGGRNLNTALNNQGLITLAANTTTNKASVVHTNSGTIDLTTGNYTIVISGTSPSFTTSGTINVPNGRVLTLQGGVSGGAAQNYNYNGGTLGGAGTVSLLNSQLNLNSGLASSMAHLDVNTSIVAGPSTFTVSAGTTVNFSSSTLSAPTVVQSTGTLELVSSDHTGGTLTNAGLVECTGACTTTGAISTQSNSILRITGIAGNSSLTSAGGFTNTAAIELTSIAAAAATLAVTTGTLTNALGATIGSLVGSAGGRNLNARLDNQGLITVAQNLTTNKASVAHTNTGTIDLTTGNYTVVISGTTPSFTTSGTINVPSGRTLTLQGGVAGGAAQNYNYNGGTLGGAGAVSLVNTQLNLNSPLATSSAHLDVNTSVVNGPSTLTISAGTTTNFAGSTLSAPTVVQATGTLQLVSTDHTAGTLTNGGLVECTGACTTTGSITTQSGSTLRVTGIAGNSSLTSAGGFTNTAAIELTSIAAAAATLTVTTGTLVNAPSGTISSLAGAGGGRNLTTRFDNQGLITLAANTTTNKASVASTNSGTIDLTTGNYTLVLSGTTPSFTTTGTINVPTGRTLTLQGGVAGGAGQNHNFNGGTLGGAGTVSLVNATLNLNVAAATNATHLDVNTSIVNGPSTLTLSGSTTTNFSGSTLNAPAVVEANGTLQLVNSDQLGTLTNGGVVDCSGACNTSGLITTQTGSTLRVTGIAGNSSLTAAAGFTNVAAIELTSSAAAASTLTLTAGTLANAATGTIRALVAATGARQLLAPLANDGVLDVQQTLTLNKAAAAHTNHGSIAIAATKTLTVTGASLTEFPGAVLSGSGTLTLAAGTAFTQNGIIRPGASPGTLRINGGLPNSSTSVLDIEVGGDNPGTGYDQLSVRDAATLAGTLNLSVVNGYLPVPGKRYVVATFPSRTGTFGTVTGLGYGVGQMWTVTYSDTDVVLMAMDQTWSRVHPDGDWPAAREGHTAVYDSTGDRMVVFGGRTDAGVQNDVWVLTKATAFNYPAWTKLAPTGTPPAARTNASAVYDPASNRMIVYGGDDGAAALGDVWVLTNANGLGGTPAWAVLAPSGTPPAARSAQGAAYDPLHDRMIVFGGDTTPAACGGELADAWVLDHASGLGGTTAWLALSPTGTPPSARAHHGAAFDAATGRLIVAAGDACGTSSTEVWLLDAANGLGGTPTWSLLAPAQTAPTGWALARYAYDRTNQWLDGFGGTVGGVPADTAYTLAAASGGGGSSWYRRAFYGTRPAPRTFHSMVIANATHTAVVFGGLTGTGRTNEVWRRMLDKGPVLDAGPPPAAIPLRTAFAMPPSPNPSSGAVRMAVDVAREQRVDLAVFDVNGRRVETLHSGVLPAGRHSFSWGEGGAAARRIPPGIYLIRMDAEDRDQVVRVVRLM